MYNYNTNDKPEYDLNASLIDETIQLYGIPVKFLVTTKNESLALISFSTHSVYHKSVSFVVTLKTINFYYYTFVVSRKSTDQIHPHLGSFQSWLWLSQADIE